MPKKLTDEIVKALLTVLRPKRLTLTRRSRNSVRCSTEAPLKPQPSQNQHYVGAEEFPLLV